MLVGHLGEGTGRAVLRRGQQDHDRVVNGTPKLLELKPSPRQNQEFLLEDEGLLFHISDPYWSWHG